jgi:hypothetical protein
VTCKTAIAKKKTRGKKTRGKQVCTTKLVTGRVKFTYAAADARATLSRAGVVYATGYAWRTRTGEQVRLLAARRLARGRHTLARTRRSGARDVTIRLVITIP